MEFLNIVFIIILIVLIVMLINYMTKNTNMIIDGLRNGRNLSTISASSLATNGSGVPSGNFAYSVWFYVNDWNYRYGQPKVIFGRMGAPSQDGTGSINGVSGVDPSPLVLLGAVENNILVSLGCFPGIDEPPTTVGGKTVVHTCSVQNIPIQKWVNLTISVFGRSMDIYIDGKLVKTCLLPGVANINNNADIQVTPSGGFDGWLSKLSFFSNPLNPQDAYNIYVKGPTSWLSNLSSYQIQLSLVENGMTQSSITI